MKIGLRELYGLSRTGWLLLVSFWCFAWAMLILNLAAIVFNLYQASYQQAAINGIVAIFLLIVLAHQQRQIARHRQIRLKIARQELDWCFHMGLCPDCGKLSLAFFDYGEIMCSEVGCNSRFHRDIVGKWRRIE